MNSIDLVTILGNLSQSLYPIQRLITGGSYLLGILFFIQGINKLKVISEGHSQEKTGGALMFIFFGSALLFLPSTLKVFANTAFGVGNVLTYSSYQGNTLYTSMKTLIKTAGILWFVRGCVLIVHASEPGSKFGKKAFLFIISGILAANFESTVDAVTYIVKQIISLTSGIN